MIATLNFRTKKDGTCCAQSYCARPEQIENYDLAMADKKRTWICHHKKEEFYTQLELVKLGIYYNVPPEDLVFVRDKKEHYSWPHKGRDERLTEEVRLKISKARKGQPSGWKGKHHSEESRKKMSEHYPRKVKVQCVETGRIFESIKAATIAMSLKGNLSIREALKNPKYTAAGYHWSKL